MTERGDAPPQERLERLRASLMGTSTRARAGRFATRGHTNVLIGASLHAADRLRQGHAVTELEQWLLDVLGAALSEQEIKDWGGVYREAVQALGDQVSVVPPVISGRAVESGFRLEDFGSVLPQVGEEHAALPNTEIVDREAVAAGASIDSPSFVQALPAYGFGATVFRRPSPAPAAFQDAGDQAQTEADRAPVEPFRVKLELESFKCLRAVGDQWGGKDEIYWCASVSSDKQAGSGFTSQEFGKMQAGSSRDFDVAQRTIFDGNVQEGLVLSLSCWEADQSPPAWVQALERLLDEMCDRIFSHWGWALVGLLPGGYTEMLIGIAAEIAGVLAWVIDHIRNYDDLSCARVILLDRYDLALMSRGKLRVWDFNGDGHHQLTIKYSGAPVPFPVGTLEYALLTDDGWSVPVTLPWETMTPPAIASYKSKLHAMYVRPADGAVMWSVRDQKGWSEPQRIHGWAVNHAPALYVYNSELHCALTGKDDVVRYAITGNGTTWPQTTQVPTTRAQWAPAMATGSTGGAFLWMTHVGKDGRLNTSLRHKTASTFQGNWADNLNWATNRSPAMAWYQNQTWRATTSTNQEIWLATGEDKLNGNEMRRHWTERAKHKVRATNHGPALAVHNNTLWCFLRTTDGTLCTFPLTNPSGPIKQIQVHGLMKPMDESSAASHDNRLYVMYRR